MPVPAEYKGLVIGRGGDKLREISTQTGAKVILKVADGEVSAEVYIVSGTEEQRQLAKLKIGLIIVGRAVNSSLKLKRYIFSLSYV